MKKRTIPVVDLRARCEAGEGEALLAALGMCLVADGPAPQWVQEAYQAAMNRWEGWQARTLGEAFNVEDRPTDPRSFQKQARHAVLRQIIPSRVEQRHDAGEAIDQEMFDGIADEVTRKGIPISGATAKNIYYQHRLTEAE